jgi:tRNA pseudouridine38-40 synthase
LLHLKLTIAYDGTGLVGWQRQATGTSVQALLEDALLPLNHAPVTVVGAGRTDAGVHALAQVASVTLARAIEPASVVRAVNMRLPPSVRVLAAERVESDFHARFRAIAKTYRYRIWNGEVVSPFERPYVWHVAGPVLDRAAMADAARRLVGRHDFASARCSRRIFMRATSDVPVRRAIGTARRSSCTRSAAMDSCGTWSARSSDRSSRSVEAAARRRGLTKCSPRGIATRPVGPRHHRGCFWSGSSTRRRDL